AGLLLFTTVNPWLRAFFALDLPRAVVLLSAVGIVAITGTVMVFTLQAVGWAKVVPEILREHPPTEPAAWRRLTRRVVESSGWDRSFLTTTEEQQVVEPEPKRDEGD
ncbi:MAG: hypothetical protein O6650_00645, partial [Actinobacteria bacterium]|nr:hypothetical protein [Actinomycetota bacterium]